jgi:hypothetical protein
MMDRKLKARPVDDGKAVAFSKMIGDRPLSNGFSTDDARDFVTAHARLAAAFWSVAMLPIQMLSARSGTEPVSPQRR